MKMIRILNITNKTFMIITGMLYLTIYFGLLFQIILGGFQLIAGILLLFYWKNYTQKHKKMLAAYWLLTLAYGTLFLIEGFSRVSNDYWYIFLAIIPMMIAVYHTVLLYNLNKDYGNIK